MAEMLGALPPWINEIAADVSLFQKNAYRITRMSAMTPPMMTATI
jgi:hypothetical protein